MVVRYKGFLYLTWDYFIQKIPLKKRKLYKEYKLFLSFRQLLTRGFFCDKFINCEDKIYKT